MLNPKWQKGKIYLLLSVNRKKWVSILSLHKVSGSYCVSTKISELRNRYDLDIENKQKRQDNGIVYSRYRLNKGVVK